MTKTEKARIAQIQFGTRLIEGLMLPNGDFAISLSQISELFQLIQTNARRDIKALLGKGFQLIYKEKVPTEINNNPSWVYSLLEFELIIARLDRKGNKPAQEFRDTLVGLSLTQLWSDAFGVKFEKEERIQYLANRQEHRKQFHVRLTPWWKLDGCEGKDYPYRVIEFKTYAGLPERKSVDDYTTEELAILNQKEIAYCALRKAGISHSKSLTLI